MRASRMLGNVALAAYMRAPSSPDALCKLDGKHAAVTAIVLRGHIFGL